MLCLCYKHPDNVIIPAGPYPNAQCILVSKHTEVLSRNQLSVFILQYVCKQHTQTANCHDHLYSGPHQMLAGPTGIGLNHV